MNFTQEQISELIMTLLSHPEYTGTEGSLLAVFQTALSQCSPASAIGGFMDQWAPAAALLRSTNQPEVLLGTVYDAAPDTVMYSYVVAHGNQLDILVDALSAIGPLTPPEYIHQGIIFLPYTPSINLYQEILKYQRIYLSSHIIYGSNRLGTKDYLPGQIYSLTDYTQAQPVKDTATLQSRRPWYSEEYQDNILYTQTEPWQATHNGIISAAERIGEKQYELSNHLGNVMATVSDNKYGVYGGTGNLSLESWRPAIRSAYDYYPFGMLMPGRYVSDTSRHCVTLSRPHWVWKWTVIGCKDYYAWVWPKLTLMGAATATPSENGILLNAQRSGEGMSFELNAQPNTENQFQLELNGLEMAKDAALQILEENGEEGWTVLAEVPIKDGEGLTVPFYPSLGKVKVVLLGPIRVFIRRVCVEGMAWVEENQLVTICDGDGDRYRWGYNGQEKVNEWAGVGNFMDFAFRGYNPQTGRFNSPDPLHEQYPWNSDYAFAENNPISGIDLEGLEYMNANEAKIEMVNGILKIKLQNLSNPSKNAIGNNNPKNWKSGEVGINLTIGKIAFKRPNPQYGAINNMTSLDNSIGAPNPTNNNNPIKYRRTAPIAKSTGNPDRRYKTNYSVNTMSPGAGSARGVGIFSLVLNTINWGLESGLNWKINQDIQDVKYQVGRFVPLINEDLNKAINKGMIPDKYLNSSDLSNIGNVILQGVNNTSTPDIYNIGMDIFNNISKDNEIKIEYRESGLDNFPSQPIIKQQIKQD